MPDILIFGDGHMGTLHKIDEGNDTVLIPIKPKPPKKTSKGWMRQESEGFYEYRAVSISFEDREYLVGVRDFPPTNKEIADAIKRYHPTPIN